MNYYQDKVIWVTGASSGIGKGLCVELAQRGARLILSARSTAQLEDIRLRLQHPEKHLVLKLDLEDSSNFSELAKQIVDNFGRIDILINNGGISQRATAAETALEIDRKIMEINYFGNIALSKAVIPYFHRQKAGQILVISSIAGKFGFFLRSAYSASKHALHGFYESLALEEEKNHIAITIACPGKINTDISVNALNSSGTKHGVMDHNQATGMSVEECTSLLLKALEQKKLEVLIGKQEIKAVTIKRFFPRLFWKIIRRQKAV